MEKRIRFPWYNHVFRRNRHAVAKRDHTRPCSVCYGPIKKGDHYSVFAGIISGEFWYDKTHSECDLQ